MGQGGPDNRSTGIAGSNDFTIIYKTRLILPFSYVLKRLLHQ